MEKIILNCEYDVFAHNFKKLVHSDAININNIYKNQIRDRYSGRLEKENIQLQKNISSLLITKYSKWTVNQLIAPTILVGTVKKTKEGLEICYSYKKGVWNQIIASFFITFPMLMLLVVALHINNLEVSICQPILFSSLFISFGLYTLCVPESDKKNLKNMIEFMSEKSGELVVETRERV